jgi:Flp pilus assembly protein TadG
MLLVMLLGVADLGWMAYNYIELTNAANAGVHFAAQSTTTATQTSLIQGAMNNDAANMTSISPAVSMVCTCSDSSKKNSDGSVPSCTKYDGCTTPARLIDTVTVTATKTVSPLIKWPGIPNSVKLTSVASMQVEQ